MEFLEKPEVILLAATRFHAAALPAGELRDWQEQASGGHAEHLTEFAGRACYQSFANPSGRKTPEYLANLLNQGHTSVFEHAAVSFYLTGVSRSFSHELVRHRAGFSYSMLSQRYVDSSDVNFVTPPEIHGDEQMQYAFKTACETAMLYYRDLLSMLEKQLADVSDRVERRKRARQTARAVLPNATETRLVVTANLTAWRWFLLKRANSHADREMRRVAVEIGKRLAEYAPGVFQDFHLVEEADGLPSWQCEHAK